MLAPISARESMEGAALSVEQKRALFRDGFVHLKGVIPKEITSAARSAIEQAERDPQPADGSVRPTGNRKTDAVRQIGAQAVATDTVNKSPITSILTEVMGEFQPPTHCQVAYTPVSNQPVEEIEGYSVSGYRNRDMPYHGAWLHHDGLCGLNSFVEPVEGTKEEVYDLLISQTNNGAETGRSAETVGSNVVPLFMDKDLTLGVGSFTCFVVVALHDQSLEGCGQTAIFPGAHHSFVKYYEKQRDNGGVYGPEGYGWEVQPAPRPASRTCAKLI